MSAGGSRNDPPPGLARGILWLGALPAPADERARLRRQWQADLVHRWRTQTATGAAAHRRAGGDGRGNRAKALRLALWALGIVPHALYLRRRRRGVGGMVEDLGQAWRVLRRRPAPAALAVLVLAMGIGSAVAVFSVAEAVLLRPLPFPDGDRLVRIYSVHRERGFDRSSVSWPDFEDMRSSEVLEDASIYVGGVADLSGEGLPERVQVARIDGRFFDVLGTAAERGRLLGPGDQSADALRVVVLSEGLWERRWGADPELLGRTIRMDGVPHTVAGILPDEHAWPRDAGAWVPFGWGAAPPETDRDRDNHAYQVVARLAPGVDAEGASQRLSEVALRARAELSPGDTEAGWEATAVPLHLSLVSADTPLLALLGGLVVLGVLLIACMNVASLLLVQARRRVRELSVRSALGAGRRRLVRQVLLESVLLALTGGVAGTVVAVLGIRLAGRSAPSAIRTFATPELNVPVLLVAVALCVVSATAAGLAPALRASRIDAGRALREGRGASGSRERRRGQRALVIAELALTTVLLMGSGLFLRSFQRQLAADPGFRTGNVATFSIVLPEGRYDEPEQVLTFRDRARDALAALPGVRDVSLTSTIPLGGGGMQLVRAFLPEGAAEPPAGPEHLAQWVEVDERYFQTLGVEPIRGRTFARVDEPGSEPVMIVTPALAEALAPDGDVIGTGVRSWRDENVYRTVVGVVPRIRVSDIGDGALPLVFVPASQSIRRSATFLLRVEGDPSMMAPAVRRVLAEMDPDIAVPVVTTLEEVHRRGLAPLRFLVTLFAVFGAAALVLAVTGVYGLVAFSVASRTREIGIRMAIGATAGAVRRSVLREGAFLTLVGLAIGAAGGALFARATASVLEGVTWTDVPTWAGVLFVLALAATAATLVPALRASRIDPVRTLGAE